MAEDEKKTAETTAAEPAGEDAAQEPAKASTSTKKKKKKKQGKISRFYHAHKKIIDRILIGILIAAVVIAIAAYAAWKIPVLDQRDGEPESYTIAAAGEWTDGTYKAQVDGKKRFTVVVTIEDGYMTDIDTSKNNETESRGAVALPQLAEAALEAQDPDVPDVMSGVTLTTDAFKDAVYRCLEKASK